MKTQSEEKNLKYGVVLSYVSLFVSIVGALLVSNKILDYVGDYNYGLYSFVNSVTSWLTVVSGALTASFLRFSTITAKNNNGDDSLTNSLYFKLLFILGFAILLIGLSIVCFLLFFKVNLFSYSWTDSETMYYVFMFSLFNIALTIPTSIFSLYVTYKKRFIFSKTLNVFILAATFLGNFLIAFLTKNIIYLSVFTIIITLINSSLNAIYCKKYLSISFGKASFKENKPLLKGICVFSSILLLNSIVDQINSNMDKTLLGIYSIPENVTIYQFGHQFAVYLVAMSTAISSIYAPTINQFVINGQEERVGELFLKISHVQLIAVCLVAFGFCSCGDSFVRWWLGSSRIDTYYVGSILMLINICPLSLNASIEIQRAKNKHLFRAIVYIVVALLNIGLSILFLTIFPKEKAIFACLLGTVISVFISHWIMMNIYNKKEIKLPVFKYIVELVKYVLIGFLTCGLVFLIDYFFIKNNIESNLFSFIAKGSLFVIVFFVFSLIIDFKFVTSLVRNLLSKKSKKEA